MKYCPKDLDMEALKKDLFILLTVFIDEDIHYGYHDTKLQNNCKRLLKSKDPELIIEIAMEYKMDLDKYRNK